MQQNAKSNNQTESVFVKSAGTRRKRTPLPGEILLVSNSPLLIVTTNSKKSAEAIVTVGVCGEGPNLISAKRGGTFALKELEK